MKTIGMIGGMSWESSIEYYRIINETVRTELGGLHSAKSMMVSLEFAEIEALQHQDRWDEAAKILIDAARSLESGGADFAIICTNTMHKLYDKIQQADIIRRLAKEGAEGIILGCTEIGLLVKPEDSPVPLFDTTEIHAKAAVQYALANEMSSP
jgi:aspartate racemase